MEIPREIYYTEKYDTLVDYNDRNNEPLFNYNIRKAIHKVIAEEEADSRNVTGDTFCQTPVTPNIQGENEYMILKSKRQNDSDVLEGIDNQRS